MRSLLFLAACWLAAGPSVHAEVLRCTDAAGHVSYTDAACPGGTRSAAPVAVPAPMGPVDGVDRAASPSQRQAPPPQGTDRTRPPPSRETTENMASPPPGAAIIDSRGAGAAAAGNEAAGNPRYSDRGQEGIAADTWYPNGAAGADHRGVPPQRDMRPRIRQCDANGCNDNLGNHYNRQGQIDRFQGADGRTCRLVNSTQVCR